MEIQKDLKRRKNVTKQKQKFNKRQFLKYERNMKVYDYKLPGNKNRRANENSVYFYCLKQ